MIYNIFPLKCPYCEKDFPIWNVCGEPYSLDNKAVNDYRCSFCNAEINMKCSVPVEGLGPKKIVESSVSDEPTKIEETSISRNNEDYVIKDDAKILEPELQKTVLRIPVLCPKCRFELTVLENAEAGLCSQCRTPFIVEDARRLFLTKDDITVTTNHNVESEQREDFMIRSKKVQNENNEKIGKGEINPKESIRRDNKPINEKNRQNPNVTNQNNVKTTGNQKQRPDGIPICCLVFGAIGILFPNTIAVLIGLAALIIGIFGLVKKETPKWMCITGLVLGILAMLSAPVKSDTESSSETKNTESTVTESQNNENNQPIEEANGDNNEVDTQEVNSSADNSSKPETTKLSKDEVMALCQDLNYKELERNPDNYVGQYFSVIVRVSMVQEGGLLNDFKRAYRTYTKSEYGWMGDSVLLKDNRDPSEPGYVKILEDDYIKVYTRFDALADMKNMINGAKSQQVCLEVLYADIISEEEAEMVNMDGQVIQISDSDFDIVEHKYESMFATSDYLVITNNSDYAVEVNGTATALDVNGATIGADDSELHVIGPKETSIFNFYFSDVKDVDKVDYKLSYRASNYTNIINDLAMDYSVSQKNVIINVTNNGSKTGEFVEATVLFFDGNNNLVNTDTTYITDEDSEIKPGATITKQATSYDDFDHVEVYLEGRAK